MNRQTFKRGNNSVKNTKGHIVDYKVSELVKNYLVGQSDYHKHHIVIQNEKGKFDFVADIISSEPRFDIGTHVSFRYFYDKSENGRKIVVKSLCKSLSPDEIAAFNEKIINEQNNNKEMETNIPQRRKPSKSRKFSM